MRRLRLVILKTQVALGVCVSVHKRIAYHVPCSLYGGLTSVTVTSISKLL